MQMYYKTINNWETFINNAVNYNLNDNIIIHELNLPNLDYFMPPKKNQQR